MAGNSTYTALPKGATPTGAEILGADQTAGGVTDTVGFTFSQIAGLALTALTGDVNAAGSGAQSATLATVNASPGTFGDATHVPQITVNAKGLVTSVTAVAISGGGGGGGSARSLNIQTANYQAVAGDSATIIKMPAGTTLTLPAAGTFTFNPAALVELVIVQDGIASGAGLIIAPASGVTQYHDGTAASPGATSARVPAAWVSCRQLAQDVWYTTGDLA